MQKLLSFIEIDCPKKYEDALSKHIFENFSNEDTMQQFDEIGNGITVSSSVDDDGNEFRTFSFYSSNPKKWIHLVTENEYNGSGRHFSGNGVKVSKLSSYSLSRILDAGIIVDEVVIK